MASSCNGVVVEGKNSSEIDSLQKRGISPPPLKVERRRLPAIIAPADNKR